MSDMILKSEAEHFLTNLTGERIISETLGLERAAAAVLLDRAHGRVKVALVMGCLDVDRDNAERRLEDASGALVTVLGDLGR